MNEKLKKALFGERPNKEQVLARNSEILILTGILDRPFKAIDSVCAMSSQRAGWDGVELDSIFEHVKNKLRDKCQELGGHAVVNCSFDYRSAHSGGVAPQQVIEIWAFGTAVEVQ